MTTILAIYILSAAFSLLYLTLARREKKWALVPVLNTLIGAWMIVLIVWCCIAVTWALLTGKEDEEP